MVAQGPKCSRCGWPWPIFHCCIDMSDPRVKKVAYFKPKRTRRGTAFSPEQMRARMLEYHANRRQENKERDQNIVRAYASDGLSVRQVAEAFMLNKRTILGVLHRAEDAGEVTIRR